MTGGGHPVASTAISDVWAAARNLALTPARLLKPGRTPLRPAPRGCIAVAERGGPPPRVAERAGHSVEVLLRVDAKCLDDGDDIANTRIDAALRDA